jgi:predicted transcriptional regulator
MTDKPKKTYGTTKSGVVITDELIEEWVAEAEAGYDLDEWEVVRGRPRMGSAPAKAFPVRLDPELRNALDDRAAREERPAAEIVREALRRYLEAS